MGFFSVFVNLKSFEAAPIEPEDNAPRN